MESCNDKDYFNNQHCCKSFLICVYFFPEAYVKLLISTSNLRKEKKEAMEKHLSQSVQCYFKYNDLSRDDRAQALKSFTGYLSDIHKVALVIVGEDSVVEGNLDKVAERYLITNEMRKEHDKNKKQTMTKTWLFQFFLTISPTF